MVVQYGGDEVSALVLDIGTNSTRAGYAGEDCPKAVFQTSYAQVETEGEDTRYYHGPSASLYRPNASIHSPLTDGIITDWSAISRNLNYCFQESLRLSKDLSDHPLLVTEPAWNTKEAKEGMCELAFEEFGVQAYYGVDRAVMSAFASGKGTALVVDVGHGSTSVVPIYDGFVLKKAIQRQPLGGELISKMILHSLKTETPPVRIVPHYLVKQKEKVEAATPSKATLRDDRVPKPGGATESYHLEQELRVIHEFKESVCQVMPGGWTQEDSARLQMRHFEYPDGYNNYYSGMRNAIPECHFDPRMIPTVFSQLPPPPTTSLLPAHPFNALQPLTSLITNTLIQIDPDLHQGLLNNIVLVGGGSLMQGFSERLSNELTKIAGGRFKIQSPSSTAERMHSSWLGGSILSSLGTFHQLWIGKEEYDEVGKSIILRRAK